MSRVLFLLVALSIVWMTGCSPDWYMHDEHFEVQNSNLNWVQIYYQATESSPRVRCDMRNGGQVVILEGKSVTVGDDFNIDYANPNFGDVRKYHYTMPADMYRDTLQHLVNVGLLERNEPKEDDPLYPKVLIYTNIDHNVTKKFTSDPELIAEIRSLLFRFKMAGQLQ